MIWVYCLSEYPEVGKKEWGFVFFGYASASDDRGRIRQMKQKREGSVQRKCVESS